MSYRLLNSVTRLLISNFYRTAGRTADAGHPMPPPRRTVNF
ncbi:MAG: hypothetical protein AAGE93_20945 [Bacteroidota bacterium]